MKIEKYTQLKDNKYNVKIDDLTVKLYDDVIIKYELLRKKEITEKEYKEIIDYNNTLESYYKALKYITIKLRTEKEIKIYLEKTYSKNVVEQTINKLKKDGYLNEDEYLKSYIYDQINLGNNGPNKIKKDLIKLGFKEEKITPYIEDLPDNIWLEKLTKIIKKKITTNKKYGNNILLEKILYDLSNKGYYKWMIEEVINSNITLTNEDEILNKEFNKIYLKLSNKYQDYELETKIINKLLAKGFNYDSIKKIIQIKKGN